MQVKRLKKGDMVKVIAGKDKGKTGKVLKIVSDKDQVVVEKLNIMKRHKRPDAKGKSLIANTLLPLPGVCVEAGSSIVVNFPCESSKPTEYCAATA